MTRADTSKGHVASIALRNNTENGKKSSTSIGLMPKRCPNLQRLIEKKLQKDMSRDQTGEQQRSMLLDEQAVMSVRNGAEVHKLAKEGMQKKTWSKTGQISPEN